MRTDAFFPQWSNSKVPMNHSSIVVLKHILEPKNPFWEHSHAWKGWECADNAKYPSPHTHSQIS
eukprot:c43034_g1_i1 orf=48-239(+)